MKIKYFNKIHFSFIFSAQSISKYEMWWALDIFQQNFLTLDFQLQNVNPSQYTQYVCSRDFGHNWFGHTFYTYIYHCILKQGWDIAWYSSAKSRTVTYPHTHHPAPPRLHRPALLTVILRIVSTHVRMLWATTRNLSLHDHFLLSNAEFAPISSC